MTDNSPKGEESESAVVQQGRLPQGHPMNVGTDPVMRGSEAAILETRIVTGETKK